MHRELFDLVSRQVKLLNKSLKRNCHAVELHNIVYSDDNEFLQLLFKLFLVPALKRRIVFAKALISFFFGLLDFQIGLALELLQELEHLKPSSNPFIHIQLIKHADLTSFSKEFEESKHPTTPDAHEKAWEPQQWSSNKCPEPESLV